MSLDSKRSELRDLDDRIIELIAKRSQIAKEIGEIKHEQGKSIRNPKLEEKVENNYARLAEEYDIREETARNIAQTVIGEALYAQGYEK